MTPGPWVHREHHGPMGQEFLIDGAGGAIAALAVVVDKIDARLIAAAPDMLMALLDLQVIAEQNVADIEAYMRDCEGTFTATEELALARWKAVGTAIDKALGLKERSAT